MKNLNEFYKEVSRLDKGFEQLDIAQIKRIGRVMATLLFKHPVILVKFLALGEKWSKK